MASRSLSPDGKHVAVLFRRDCEATTGFSRANLGIGRQRRPFRFREQIFIADDDHGAARIGSWDGSWAETKWLSADHLLIRYAAKSRLFKQNARVSDVSVVYLVRGS
ncbi:hypothetical protein AWL63_11725 [Sphingomonas panacis]|uniref:Uncharacterized protein n=1 Tax=Sphingomonas panacis TaxID=1560345 RepID=A0A1B3ZAU5_9SPHN|nr:hypothetical protein [Sphingomonas panacis]AOH84537.1 hypothetical protein AWL63_11725 [Sphingomonas panacis]